MAIAVAMNNNQEDDDKNNNKHEDDEHENDVVMPGFRFHPTEEELVEFYLRRKVEGKRFNFELITFLDLYRYDPWELPALAAIGEDEWYFYVPRDRKYRNGDRPNRVTTSGYWKATGADRMVRSDQNNSRSIGLKKTLVFYSGKAPKGIRTSWIMNEYRLPHHETERLQKVPNLDPQAEISICRVYKRAGVEDHPSLPRSLPTSKASSSSSRVVSQPPQKLNEQTNHQGSSFQTNYNEMPQQKVICDTSPSSSNDVGTSLSLSKHSNSYNLMNPLIPMDHSSITPPNLLQEDHHRMILNQSSVHAIDDLHKLVSNYSQCPNKVQNLPSHFSTFHQQEPHPQPQPQTWPMTLNVVPGPVQGGFSDRLWDWNGISEAGKEYNNLFKEH